MAREWVTSEIEATAYLIIFFASMFLWDIYQYLKSLVMNCLVFQPVMGYTPAQIPGLQNVLLTGLCVGIASVVSLAILKTKIVQRIIAGTGIPVRDWATITLLNIPIMVIVFLVMYFILTPLLLGTAEFTVASALISAIDLSVYSGLFTLLAFYVAEAYRV